jgi:DNA polymerase-3 subunit alpha (Gram-positive type)
VEERMAEIEHMGKDASKKDENDFTVLEVAYEMYARGYEFAPARLGISDATKFRVHEGKVVLPFVAIAGMGEGAAAAFAEGYADRPYETVEDVIDRGRVNKTVVEQLREHGVLEGLPETAQISFF